MGMTHHEQDPAGCIRIPSDLEGAIVFPMPEISDEEAEAFERLAQAETTEEVTAALDEVIQVEGGHAIIENDGVVLELEMRGITDVRGLLLAVLFAMENEGFPVPEWLEQATN